MHRHLTTFSMAASIEMIPARAAGCRQTSIDAGIDAGVYAAIDAAIDASLDDDLTRLATEAVIRDARILKSTPSGVSHAG